jgi:hypothetical protein
LISLGRNTERQREPEVLAPTTRRKEPGTGQPGDKIRLASQMPAHGTGMPNLHCGDRAADEESVEPGPNGLYFRKFRHA